MNYQKHYDRLCERARNRQLEGYTEKHHVLPRCLGGTDDQGNLVELTPEEHYVAHQLLVKIHPEHSGLIFAAIQMTGSSKNQRRNKIYGWLKRKQSKATKRRTGKKNGSYGRHWYHKPGTLENIKCLPDEVPDGFVKGRKLKPDKPDKPNSKCSVCGNDTGTEKANYCDFHRRELRASRLRKMTIKFSDRDIVIAFRKTKSIVKTIKMLGMTDGSSSRNRIKRLITNPMIV